MPLGIRYKDERTQQSFTLSNDNRLLYWAIGLCSAQSTQLCGGPEKCSGCNSQVVLSSVTNWKDSWLFDSTWGLGESWCLNFSAFGLGKPFLQGAVRPSKNAESWDFIKFKNQDTRVSCNCMLIMWQDSVRYLPFLLPCSKLVEKSRPISCLWWASPNLYSIDPLHR